MEQLKGKNVIIWSENTAAEASTRSGRAREFDQGAIIHSIRKLAAVNKIGIRVKRVPTKDNIADDPSRERYDLLARAKATYGTPVLHKAFEDPCAWKAVAMSDSL